MIRASRSTWRRAVSGLLAAALGTALAVVAAPTAEAATVTISADYRSDAGAFDKAKILNANEGGYLTHNSLNWLPEAYDPFKEAGLQLVTITHLLNENFYNIVSGTGPNFSYDYTKLDRVIQPLLDKGLTPMMGLAFTPEVLGGATKAQGFSNAIPNNNEYWKLIVQNVVQHYKDKGHTGWYWEVWNEPNLGTSFWNGTQAEYNALYKATAEGVKAADPTAKIGGPATAQPTGPFIRDFTNYLGQNPSVPLDYLSFHEYGESFDLTQAEADLARNGRAGTPIFITEWHASPNMTQGPGAMSDTNVMATYAAWKMSHALTKPGLSKIFHFAPKEGLTPTKLFNGDLGLLTVDNHRKAVFNTYKLFNSLGPTRLSTNLSGAGTGNGQVGAITTKDPDSKSVALLMWNHQNTPTDVSVNLSNLPYAADGKNIRVTQYVIDAHHGNYYADFAAGIRGWDVGPSENLRPQESKVVPGSSTFARNFVPAPNALVAYVLEPTSDAVTDAAQVGPTPIAVGSRNLAHGRPVSTSSSIEAWSWSKAALTDGLNHSFSKADAAPAASGWSSDPHTTSAATESAYVDLGSSLDVDRMVLWPRDDKECEGYGFPKDFALQGTDNPAGTWTDLAAPVANYNNGLPLPPGAGAQTFAVTGKFRYVRVIATSLQPACAGDGVPKHFQLAELQVYGGANMAAGATVTASSSLEDWGWSTRHLTDGQETSDGPAYGYSSEWGRTDDPDVTVRLTLPSTRTISRIDLFPRTDAGNEGKGFPIDFSVRVANDANCTTWSTVVARGGYWNPGRFAQTFGFAPRATRCVEIQATRLYRFTDSGFHLFQLGEVKLYN